MGRHVQSQLRGAPELGPGAEPAGTRCSSGPATAPCQLSAPLCIVTLGDCWLLLKSCPFGLVFTGSTCLRRGKKKKSRDISGCAAVTHWPSIQSTPVSGWPAASPVSLQLRSRSSPGEPEQQMTPSANGTKIVVPKARRNGGVPMCSSLSLCLSSHAPFLPSELPLPALLCGAAC